MPTGLVEFWEVDAVTGENLVLLGTGMLDPFGQALFTISTLTPGQHRIKALYLGDGHYQSSFMTMDQTII
jgi:hypothetical protein